MSPAEADASKHDGALNEEHQDLHIAVLRLRCVVHNDDQNEVHLRMNRCRQNQP